MDILTSDWEVTTWNKGNPFDLRNKAVCLAWKFNNEQTHCSFEFDLDLDADLYVFFNAKFDAHWYRKLGFILPTKIWCCQLAEFLLSGQTERYPSLENTAIKYGLGHKIDLIKEEFWERKCTCHVSVATRWQNYMQKNFAKNVITTTQINHAPLEQKKKEFGENLTQNAIKLLLSDERRNYGLILQHRLDTIKPTINESTNSQILNTLCSWNKQAVKFVEQLAIFASITATQQEKLEVDCVEHVMLLWDILNDQNGWNKHSPICEGHSHVNTDEIPRDVLSEYAKQDVELTYAIYLKQLEQFQANPLLFKLFKLQCQDLLVLEEMEWNGLVFDEQKCLDTADVLDKEIEQIKEGLSKVYPDVSINFNSGDQLSAFLFGGVIKEETKEHIGFYKTGDKAGQPKYKNVIKEHVLPRLVEPGKSTKKDGVFKTDEATLRKLKGKAAKTFVGPLLRLAELDKLNSTYYRGLVNKRIEMNWPEGEIHGQFNQVVAGTGRLSSSSPNLQNFSGECLDVFISRYEN